jgi:opacity protein-like surface antigen
MEQAMARLRLASAVVALGVACPAIASAQSKGNCPPGSWFCADAPGLTPSGDASSDAPADDDAATAPAPAPATPPPNRARPAPRQRLAPNDDADAPPPTVYVPAQPSTTTTDAPPPIVVYQPAPRKRRPRIVYVAPPPVEVAEPPPPPPPPPRRSEWGLQFRLEGVMMGSSRAQNASMGGAGLSIRPRPSPHFALDFGIDALSGTDYVGNQRSEGAFTINPMLFVNPRSKVQLYFLAGLGFAGATVHYGDQTVDHFSYFGLDGGAGLELRLSRHVALDIDFVGFIRDRTDRGADAKPEFTDPNTGRTTNTSGGGLARLGLGFYW